VISAKIILGLTAITLVPFATVANAQESTSRVIKITDSKLAAINMGLDSTEHWVTKMKQGDSKRGATLVSELEKLATRFNRIPKSDDDQYNYIVNRFASLAEAIQAKSGQSGSTQPTQENGEQMDGQSPTTNGRPHRHIFTVNKQLDKIETTLRSFDPGNLSQAKLVKEQLAYARQMFERIPVSRHPDFVSTKKRIDAISAQLGNEVPQWKSDEDPIDFLAEMRIKYLKTLALPRAQKVMSTRELTTEDIRHFVGDIAAFRSEVGTDLPKIRAAALATGTASDLVAWLERESTDFIETETSKLLARLDRTIDTAMKDFENLAGLDPDKNKYTFVTESVRKNNEDKFARTIRTMENAKAIEDAFNQPGRWSSRKAELEKHLATYREKAGQASTVTELPIDIGDAELEKIARQTLAIEKYGVGKVERMIVNSRKVPRDSIKTRFFNGALETIVRKWDEYQVCTVEIENGKHIVYFNTLRNFSRGPATTTIDQWILANRFKSGEISADLLK